MSTALGPDTHEHEAVAPEAPEAEHAPLACPSCGAPAAGGQLMCLECGSRLALDYRRPPSWRLPAAIVGVVVLLAGAGVALALLAATDDASPTTAAAPAGQTAPQSAPADTPPTASTPSPAPPADASTPTPAPATDDGGTAAGGAAPESDAGAAAPPAPEGWPPGKSAFTVVLASMPSEAAAKDKLEKAQAAGITGAAILHSDDFPTLNPGYWVVFDGQYDSIEQAQSQAETDRGKGGFGDAYPRFVSKNEDAQP